MAFQPAYLAHGSFLSQTQLCEFFDISNCVRQKWGTILENKVVQKLKFSKSDNNKKPSSKLIFFNEKKNQKNLNDF